MTVLNGKKTYIAAAALFLLGAFLIYSGSAEAGVMPIAMALGFIGLRSNQQRNAQMIARALADVKQVALDKQPLTKEQKALLIADGMQVAGDVMIGDAEPK
jgi:hypothetical protein